MLAKLEEYVMMALMKCKRESFVKNCMVHHLFILSNRDNNVIITIFGLMMLDAVDMSHNYHNVSIDVIFINLI